MKTEQIIKWLSELNIKTEVVNNNFVKINRTDMINVAHISSESFYEDNCYDDVLTGLKEITNDNLYWCGKDDDYLYLKEFKGIEKI